MANKGLQFEHAVMYAATSRINEPRTREQEKFFTEAAKKWNDIPQDIKDKATELVTDMAPRGVVDKQKYYGSFKKCLVVEQNQRQTLCLRKVARLINAL